MDDCYISQGCKEDAYSGYVVPSTGQLLLTKPSWFNYETVIQSFREFLSRYPLKEGKKLYLVLDNAPWHKKAVRLVQTEAWPEYQDIRDRMVLVPLPPYSPDLNPMEQCWRITRREVTHNVYHPDVSALESNLDAYFINYCSPNEKFSSLCLFNWHN